MSERKIGLALGSGAARGLAHVGVLEALENGGIHIDMVAGTSIGAIVGAFYAAGKDVAEIEKAVKFLARRQILSLADFTVPTRGLVGGKKIAEWLKSVLGDRHFKDLNIPFACVATDITTGEEVVIKDGPVATAVQASASIPVIFTPVRLKGRYLVDGGLVNPIPVSVLREMGADFVIAVNVVPHIGDRVRRQEAEDGKKPGAPNIFGVISHMLYIMGYQAAVSGIKKADAVIVPEVSHIRPDGFYRARECILLGKHTALHALPEIKKQLEG